MTGAQGLLFVATARTFWSLQCCSVLLQCCWDLNCGYLVGIQLHRQHVYNNLCEINYNFAPLLYAIARMFGLHWDSFHAVWWGGILLVQ